MASITVNPNAGSQVQGTISVANAVWALARAALTGDSANVDPATGNLIFTRLSGGNYTIIRSFFVFDTSALTAGAVITSAVISFAGESTAESDIDTDTVEIVAATPAADNTLTTADFDQVGAVSFGSMLVGNWVQTNNTYNDITLNASGIANINKTGNSRFAALSGRDFNNNAPTGNANSIACKMNSGAQPQLVVTYTLAGSSFLAMF